jgi:hypothetical protein
LDFIAAGAADELSDTLKKTMLLLALHGDSLPRWQRQGYGVVIYQLTVVPDRSMHDYDARAAPPPGDRRCDFVARTLQPHIRFGIADAQAANMQIIEEFR